MSKRPQWMSKKAMFVAHPATTLREAAKVIRIHSAELRRGKLPEQASQARWIADALERVAGGQTWEEAFLLNVDLS